MVKRGGNVLPIGLALDGGMPEVFVVIKAASMACIVLQYFRKNAIKVTIRRMSQRKAVYEQITDADCHVLHTLSTEEIFFYFEQNHNEI